MLKNLKYTNEIDWEYCTGNKFSSTNRNFLNNLNTLSRKKNTKNNKSNFENTIDYRTFDFKHEFINNKKPSFNFSSIYYGVLFLFIVGFLFFLTISISYASTNKLNGFNEDLFYNKESNQKILTDYLLNNQDKKLNKTNSKYNSKKISYSEYTATNDDTFEKVAKKFGTSVETIYLTNNIKKKISLKQGKRLIIPNQEGRLVAIQKNDSIYKLANKYGIKWEKIADTNSIENSIIPAGSKVFIPESKMTKFEKKEFESKNFAWPTIGTISSPFGPRIDPITGVLDFHTGVDITNIAGTLVKASKEGKVIFTGWQSVYGNFIMIKHDNNIITLYAHLECISVKNGQQVNQGDVIGKIGSTGRVTGPHLHFEVRIKDKLVNPLSYL